MIERLAIFLILGLFVFAPQVQSFFSEDSIGFYRNYVYWLALVLMSGLATRENRDR